MKFLPLINMKIQTNMFFFFAQGAEHGIGSANDY